MSALAHGPRLLIADQRRDSGVPRGGQVLNGPVPMWEGWIGVFSDPQGAPFALWTGHYDD